MKIASVDRDRLRYVAEEALVFLVLIFAVMTAQAVRHVRRGQAIRWADVFRITPEVALRIFAAVGSWAALHQVWKKAERQAPLLKRLFMAAAVGRGFRGEDG